MPTPITCDHCGAEISESAVVPYEADTGEVYYFCNASCRAKCGHLAADDLTQRGRGEGSAEAPLAPDRDESS